MAPKKKSISENERALGAYQAEAKAIREKDKELSDSEKKRLEFLDKQEKKLKKVLEIQRELFEVQQDSVDNFQDIDDELTSIGNRIGKNSTLYEVQRKRIAAGAEALASISIVLKNNTKLTEKDRDGIVKYTASYKENLVSVANINRRYAEGKIDKEEANKLIDEATQKHRENTASIELSNEAMEAIGPTMETINSEIESFGNLAQKSLGHIKHMDEIFESFEGIPALGALNKLLKTNIKDTLAFKAAVFALGAALGKAAFDYFGAPIKAAMQAEKERHQNEIDTIADVAKLRKDAQFIPAKIGQERLEAEIEATNQINNLMHEAAYAGQKAAIQFSSSMQSGAAQFERAAKTALFGNKLGSVGYGAAQLQLAGISADKIASSMEAASAATGKMPTASAAADMAVMAERTGQSVDDIASINESFMRMDGMSANVAMNMQEGMRNMADQAGIGLGNLMKEVAQASKEALGYQIKSGPALAKAVAYTQSMGLNFGDVAKAGKNMVLNYKDSIKAEMQLSSMLGEQVDLAEVRAKFAAGDTEGALSSLKSQGLDPADMDQFQQEALQQALGGMDLNSLSKVANNTGKEVGLSEGNAKGGNKDFLSRTQSAEASLSAQQASISAQTAIVDAQLSKQIADAYLASPEYTAYKNAQTAAAVSARELEGAMTNAWKATDEYKKSLSDSMKLNFIDTIKEGFMSGLATIGGGLLTTGLSKLIPGGKGGGVPGAPAGGGVAAAITGGGGAGGVVDAVTGGGGVAGVAAAGADAIIPGAGGVVESITSQIDAVQEPLEKAMSFGEKLKDLGKGLGSFLKSIGQGVGGAIKAVLQGIGQGLLSVATGLVALTPAIPVMLAFGAAILLTTPALMALAPVVIKIAEVIGDVLVKALESAGPIITSIFKGIALVIETIGKSIALVITTIADSISKLSGLDAGKMLGVAGGITAMAGAVAIFGGASAVGGFMSAVGSFFGGDPVEKFRNFQNLDANQLRAVADSIGYLGRGIGSFQIPPTVAESVALLGVGFSEFADYLNDGEIDTMNAFTSALGGLNTQLMQTAAISGLVVTTASAFTNLAGALDSLGSVNVKGINDLPWLRLIAFANAGGRITLAQSANNSFNIAADTAKNIEKLTTDTKANLQVSKNLQALIAVLANENTAGTQLIIDGKAVADMLTRRDDNRKGTKTT